jgi:hypothetical protein
VLRSVRTRSALAVALLGLAAAPAAAELAPFRAQTGAANSLNGLTSVPTRPLRSPISTATAISIW